MDERIAHLPERQFMEHAEFLGVDYPALYMCKSKRGIKREDGGKDAYKLPHRLIEKKRRDRINECIGQLKDLLPEHLKLSTLGHLEKAVVLELTLKHLNALTTVTEQQHQKILALQNGERPPVKADAQDAFHTGFQTCAKEVLQYLGQVENWSAREQRCAQLVSHLHKVLDAQHKPDSQANCVPVIQRTQEVSETDTDTDSGYGGEADKDKEAERSKKIKQEFGDERAAKKPKTSWSGSDGLMNSLMGITNPGQQQTPICMPFYFINPAAAAAAASYMPLFDKNSAEKFVYPAALASPFPWLYPAHAAAAAAAAASSFPGLSAHLGSAPAHKDSGDSDGAQETDSSSPEETPACEPADDDVSNQSDDS